MPIYGFISLFFYKLENKKIIIGKILKFFYKCGIMEKS